MPLNKGSSGNDQPHLFQVVCIYMQKVEISRSSESMDGYVGLKQQQVGQAENMIASVSASISQRSSCPEPEPWYQLRYSLVCR